MTSRQAKAAHDVAWCALNSTFGHMTFDQSAWASVEDENQNPNVRVSNFRVFSNLSIEIVLFTPTMSDSEAGDGGRASPTPGGRHEKSLGLLTSKFVELLQGAEGGVLDLKKVASQSLGMKLSLSLMLFPEHLNKWIN